MRNITDAIREDFYKNTGTDVFALASTVAEDLWKSMQSSKSLYTINGKKYILEHFTGYPFDDVIYEEEKFINIVRDVLVEYLKHGTIDNRTIKKVSLKRTKLGFALRIPGITNTVPIFTLEGEFVEDPTEFYGPSMDHHIINTPYISERDAGILYGNWHPLNRLEDVLKWFKLIK